MAGLALGTMLLAGIVAVGAFAVSRNDDSTSTQGTPGDPQPTAAGSTGATGTSAAPSKAAATERDARRYMRLTRVSYDGDTLSDIGIQTVSGPGSVDVLRSNGSAFGEAEDWASVAVPPPGRPAHRLNGDFDGDGHTDAAVVEDRNPGQRVSVLASQGASFASPVSWGSIPAPIANGTYPLVGDFDGDGRMDLASVGWNSAGVNVTVLLSTGTAFQPASLWAENLKWSFSATSLIPGDFNGDGKTDLAAVRQVGESLRVDVVLSEGSRFVDAQVWQRFRHPDEGKTKLVAGDFDGDGTQDLLLYLNASETGGASALFLHSTASSFRPPREWWTDPQWDVAQSWVSAGDYNGDGYTDVARIAPSSTDGVDVWVLLSTGDSLSPGRVWGSWPGHDFADVRTLNRVG
jgi:FG-GAP-like repeat